MEFTFIHILKKSTFFAYLRKFSCSVTKFAERKISVALMEYELFGMILKQGKYLLRYFQIHVEFLVLSFESLLSVKHLNKQFKYVFNIEKVNKIYLYS